MNKNYRLKKNYEIDMLMKNKLSVGNMYYAIYYQYCEEEKPLIAISVSKKLGNAVVRNYKKRVIREIVSKTVGKMSNIKLLIVERKKAQELDFSQKNKELTYLINKIMKKKEQK